MYNDLMKNHGTYIEPWGYTVIFIYLFIQVLADYQGPEQQKTRDKFEQQ